MPIAPPTLTTRSVHFKSAFGQLIALRDVALREKVTYRMPYEACVGTCELRRQPRGPRRPRIR